MAYRYGSSFNQPPLVDRNVYNEMISQYGTTDLNRIQSQQEQSALAAESQAEAIAMRQRQAALENELRAKRDDERQRNILGLSPLSAQLADENSAAYQWTRENGNTPQEDGFGAEMTIGGTDGSAPPSLPMVRPRLGRLSRTIRPEFEQAQQQMRAEDSERVAPMQSPYENPIRQQQADTDEIAALTKVLESLDEDDAMRPQVVARLQAKLAPAQATTTAPVSAPPPAAQPQAQAGGDQVIKETSAGRYIQLADGSIDFEYKDGRRIKFSTAAQ